MSIFGGLVNGYKKQVMAKVSPELVDIKIKFDEFESAVKYFSEGMTHEEEIEALKNLFPRRTDAQLERLREAFLLGFEMEQEIEKAAEKLLDC